MKQNFKSDVLEIENDFTDKHQSIVPVIGKATSDSEMLCKLTTSGYFICRPAMGAAAQSPPMEVGSGAASPGALFIFFFFFFLNFILFIFFIQQVLISHQFYTHQCIHVNPNRPIHHTTIPTPCRFPPLVSTCLFSTSVSQFLPCKLVHLYHFSRFHISALIYDISFSLSDLLHFV